MQKSAILKIFRFFLYARLNPVASFEVKCEFNVTPEKINVFHAIIIRKKVLNLLLPQKRRQSTGGALQRAGGDLDRNGGIKDRTGSAIERTGRIFYLIGGAF